MAGEAVSPPASGWRRFGTFLPIVLLAIGAFLTFLFSSWMEVRHAFLLAALFLLCASPWFLRGSGRDLAEPVYFTSIFLFLIYPVRTLMLLAFPEYTVGYFPPPYDPALVTEALWYTIFGVVAYLTLYYGTRPMTHFGRMTLPTHLDGWLAKILLLYTAGWLMRFYQIATMNYSTFITGEGYDPATSTLFLYISELATLAYIFTWIYVIQRRFLGMKTYLLILLVVATEAAYALTIQGSKTHLLRILVFPGMAYYLIRRKLPVAHILLFIAIAILFVFPYIQTYRDIYIDRFGMDLEVSFTEGVSITQEAVAEMYSRPGHYTVGVTESTPVWLTSLIIFLNRWTGFDGTAIMLESVPRQFGHVFGKDLFLVPFALIPRFLWPSKPESDVQKTFDLYIVGSPSGSTSPYPIAEGYFNGGLMGILFVMASLAVLQRLLYSGFFSPRRDGSLAIAIYIWLFIWVTQIDTWVLPMYVYLLQRIIIVACVCLLFARQRPETGR